jgi:hypothetical protein
MTPERSTLAMPRPCGIARDLESLGEGRLSGKLSGKTPENLAEKAV